VRVPTRSDDDREWRRRYEAVLAPYTNRRLSAEEQQQMFAIVLELNTERLAEAKAARPWTETWWEETDDFDGAMRAVMSVEDAALIRELRAEKHATYRFIASWCAEHRAARWRVDWVIAEHQEVGTHLCDVAAELLGEDPTRDPWA
jgi:predicted oxidoreductase (fatty acid repression mutant protein)